MKVRELMTTEPITVEPDTTLGEVATLMKQEDCGSIPVVEAGRLVGIVTDRDIVIRGVAGGTDPKTQRVSTIMSADPVTIGADDDVTEAEKVMADRQIRRLPVIEDGRLVGIIVTAQIARADDKRKVGETLREISEPTSGRGSHARG
ncbi:MAG: CBS domain-containing protein [Chloroflexi bacterium]|nr:MAG: CBS domain-containing protein [Chloroflexota bacterium]TMF63277.1 MAG: CBS domain-containing protein [Chloroflexota bacterium]